MQRKILSILLACVMLVSLLPSVGMAAEERKILFSTDFEAETAGANPTKSGFDSVVSTDVACFKTADDNGNKVLKAYHGDPVGDPNSKGPRMEVHFATEGLTNLRIEYDIKYSGGATKHKLFFRSGKSNSSLGILTGAHAYKDWTHIVVDANVKTQTATVTIDGKVDGTETFTFEGESKVKLLFSATVAPDDSWVMLDNIQISTTDKDYDRNKKGAIELSAEYKEEDAKEETGNIISLLDVDFENDTVGKVPSMDPKTGFTSSAITTSAAMTVAEENGNKVLKVHHGDPENEPVAKGPRMERAFPTIGLKTMTIDFDVKANEDTTSVLTLSFRHPSTTQSYGSFQTPVNFKEWTHIKIRCDFIAKKSVIYVNGREYATKAANCGAENSFKIRFGASVQPDDSYILLDNIKITSPDLELGGIADATGTGVHWDRVKIDDKQKTGMLEVMRMEHPRLFVTDWDVMRQKAESSDTYKTMKRNIISAAEGAVQAELTQYVRGSTGTINGATTNLKLNVIVLSAAYKLTGDVRYKDKLYAQLESAGNWPDWGHEEFLCCAHMNLAYAVAYDWLYHDWTQTERNNIKGWLMEKGLAPAILCYEGFLPGAWPRRVSNWNNVCNGSNLIAALAIADSEPDVADYILRKAADGIPYMYSELSEEGGYIEPLGYWDYGIRHMVKTMSALDTCLLPGQSLPKCLDFKDVVGMNNTGDFPIYFNGASLGFNYGDGEDALRVSPILYYLATKYDKPHYAWYDRNMRETNPKVSELTNKNAVWGLIWFDEAHMQNAEFNFPLDKFYASQEKGASKALSMRSSWTDKDALIVMAMSGDADVGHGHHNAGGFVMDWAGMRWAHIYGRDVPGYASTPYDWDGYFSRSVEGGRYSYYHTRGEANNTIIANPQQNKVDMNLDYVTHLEKHASSDSKAFGVINMTETNKDYISAMRGFMITDNRDTLIIQDEITANKPSEYYWFMNTHADITVAPDGKSAILEQKGEKMLMRITQGPADAKIGIRPAQPLPTSPDPDVQPDIEEHKLFIHVQNQQVLNLTVEITGLHEGEGIPAPQPVVAIADWSVEDAPARTTSQTLGNVVALKVDNPNAYAQGAKTYVDTENLDIKPIVQNGRTLVPVRFIAEKFGAEVGWEDATQTVTVNSKAGTITLQLGSNQMNVNGNITVLDVPAQEIGGRTLIPLRALVEALGKQVFWDDRGLILITDTVANYDAATIDNIIDLLDIRVQADGKEIKFFDSEVYEYDVKIAKGAAIPNVTASSDKGATVVQGNPATVTVGDRTYTFRFAEDAFEGVLGTGSAGVVKELKLYADNGAGAPYQTYLDIVGATSSIEWDDKYPMNGSYDGIINGSVTQNRWSANGEGQWISYDLGAEKNVHSIAISGYKYTGRSYTFKISASSDGANWTTVQEAADTAIGVDHTVIPLGDVKARYIRLDGIKATNTTWMGICEVHIYDSAQMEADDQQYWKAFFYSNTMAGMAGQSQRLRIEGESALGEIIPVSFADVKLTSLNPEIASVDAAGNVTLHKAGTTRIRAEAMINGILKTTAIEVEVN